MEENEFVEDVRVTGSHGGPAAAPTELAAMREQRRTEQQRHTDQALTAAGKAVETAIEEAESGIAWLESVGAQLPQKLETLPVVLRQLAKFVEDEKGRRG